MIRILRSLCQDANGPSQRANLEKVLERQVDFSGQANAHLRELYGLVKDYAIRHSGELPSLQTLKDDCERKWGVGCKQAKFVDTELSRWSPYLDANFTHLVEQVLADQAIDTAKSRLGLALTQVDAGRASKTPLEIIDELTVTATRTLIEVREKLVVDQVKIGGVINDQTECDDYLQELEDQLKRGPKLGLLCGYEPVDMQTKGWQYGEVVLVAGYTGECKSTITRNMLYHMATLFGYNVLLISCEQTRQQCRDHFLCMHSTHPRWGRDALRYDALKNRLLTPADVAFVREVYGDLVNNPDYGLIDIQQPGSRSITWSEVVARAQVTNIDCKKKTGHGLDIICLDYYDWVDWDGRKSDDTDVNEMVRASKQLAMSWENGRGVVFIAPWQINNAGHEYAIKHDGEYLPDHLSTHNQSRRAADHIYSVFLGPEGSKYRRSGQLKLCCLKARDGDAFPPFVLQTELSASRVHNTVLSSAAGKADETATSLEDVAETSLAQILDEL